MSNWHARRNNKSRASALGDTTNGGAIEGRGKQVWLQIVGALFIIGWNLVWTSLILCFIKYVCRIPLRMSEEELLIGDDAIHGEEAYCFSDEVIGVVPDSGAEERAIGLAAKIHQSHEYDKDISVIEGRAPSSLGNGTEGYSARNHKEQERKEEQIKTD